MKNLLCFILLVSNYEIISQTYLQPQLLRDINPTMNPFFTDLKKVGHQVFFFASDSAYNNTFWASDGTAEGTREVKEINPGPNADWWSLQHDISTSIIGMRDTAYFFAYRDDIGYELWKSAGHDSNTVLVKDINPGPGSALPTLNESVVIHPIVFQNLFFFVAYRPDIGYEVWRSNGTEAGTFPVSNIPGNNPSLYPTYLQVVGNRLFFATDTWGTTEPGGFYASDGTPAGTFQFSNLIPSHLMPMKSLFFPQVGEWIYFSARETGNGNNELFRVKEDLSVVELVYDFNQDNEGDPTQFSYVSGGFLFQVRNGSTGGADHLALLCNGTVNINEPLLLESGIPIEGDNWIAWNNRVLIQTQDDSIYVSDGTQTGTRSLGLAGNINGLSAQGMSTYSLPYGENIIFIFDDDDFTYLMISNGTEEGTFPLLDPQRWYPRSNMALKGDTLFIELIDDSNPDLGIELYTLNLSDLPSHLFKNDEKGLSHIIYPNPSKGQVSIEGASIGSLVEVRSLEGLLIESFRLDAEKTIRFNSGIAHGHYLLTWLDSKTGKIITSRTVLLP